jgi:hypothetical protein
MFSCCVTDLILSTQAEVAQLQQPAPQNDLAHTVMVKLQRTGIGGREAGLPDLTAAWRELNAFINEFASQIWHVCSLRIAPLHAPARPPRLKFK